jgi:hypothetical protein
MPALDETASFVIDDADAMPGQLDSPSQISQGTVSLANEMEDTQAGVHAPRRTPNQTQPVTTDDVKTTAWRRIAVGVGLVAAAAAAAWLIGLL